MNLYKFKAKTFFFCNENVYFFNYSILIILIIFPGFIFISVFKNDNAFYFLFFHK